MLRDVQEGRGDGAPPQRPEEAEHGLHILFGFYQNFFYTIRHVYHELRRPEGHPLRTWRQAFHPRDLGVEEEFVEGEWDPWIITFPGNAAVPGSNGALLTLPQYLMMFLQGVISHLFGWRASYWVTRALFPRRDAWEAAHDPPIGGKEPWGAMLLARSVYRLIIGATHAVQFIKKHASWLVAIYEGARNVIWPFLRWLASHNRRAYRTWRDVDAMLAMLTGTLSDGLLLEGGFDKVDKLDYRAWLIEHGVHPHTLSTTLVRTIYDAAFSYEEGDPNRQRVSAGSTVRILLRWAMTYKGAAFYRMQAGMGDAVFAPLYRVLQSRGVKVEFFHKVESLHLSADKSQIASIKINKQVELADGVAEYNPLVTIKGLECWPSAPITAHIKDPGKIEGIDLEDYYSGYVGREIHLELGTHFDQVLFGIPIAAVRFLCKELVDNPATPAWREMTHHIKAVQTVAAQLWLKDTIGSLGWETPEPLLSLFVEPFNTWSDMTNVIDREDWPAEDTPKDVSYLTGAQRGPADPPPLEEHDFSARMTTTAYDAFARFLLGTERNPNDDPAVGGITTLLPRARLSPDSPEFNWDLLVDARNSVGAARLKSQYWRSNCGPSERCTLSLPNTNQYRMKAGETGYKNLYITGDWTDNNLYLAFMEASFQAGILSARAIAGEKFPIIGEWLNSL